MSVLSQVEGKTWKDIAVHLPHRTVDAVRNKAKKMIEMNRLQAVLPVDAVRQEEDDDFGEANRSMDTEEADDDVQNSMDAYLETPPLSPDDPAADDEDRRRKPWTPDEDDKLRRLVKKVKPITPEQWDYIAAQLGRTVKSIKHKFNDYGLKALMDEE
jgi:hypothetical protein